MSSCPAGLPGAAPGSRGAPESQGARRLPGRRSRLSLSRALHSHVSFHLPEELKAVFYRITGGPCVMCHGPHARVGTGPVCSRGSVGGVMAELAGQARPAVSHSPWGPCRWSNCCLHVKVCKKKGVRTSVSSHDTCVILCVSSFKTAS